VAPALLAALPLRGRVVTGDALYCQRALCAAVRRRRGDYLVIVRENQPELLWAIATLFADPPVGERFATAATWDKHGDRVEVRRLWASTALAGYLDWPGALQVARVERTCDRRGRRTREVRYLITSLAPAIGPAALLRRVRQHWGIENRLHWVRDVTMGEDASQVRSGAAPQVMAALRNAVIGLLRRAGWDNIAAGLRHYGWRRDDALALLGITAPG
jgi:predicted transposase YbfD/YdcC